MPGPRLVVVIVVVVVVVVFIFVVIAAVVVVVVIVVVIVVTILSVLDSFLKSVFPPTNQDCKVTVVHGEHQHFL